jgi:arsenate reductase
MAFENDRPKILFLCTGNSARSIFAEYLTKKIGRDRFDAYSARSEPTGKVNPFALSVLQEQYGIDTRDARSKSWDEFKDTPFDIIITVCDKARESCPIFPGQPIVAHWRTPDPALAQGTDEQKLRQFGETARQIQRRIELLCFFPIEKLGHLLTQPELNVEIKNQSRKARQRYGWSSKGAHRIECQKRRSLGQVLPGDARRPLTKFIESYPNDGTL